MLLANSLKEKRDTIVRHMDHTIQGLSAKGNCIIEKAMGKEGENADSRSTLLSSLHKLREKENSIKEQEILSSIIE